MRRLPPANSDQALLPLDGLDTAIVDLAVLALGVAGNELLHHRHLVQEVEGVRDWS